MTVTLRPSPEEAALRRTAGEWSDELIDGFVLRVAADPEAAAGTAIVDGEVTISYAELEQQVRSVSGALRGMGIGKGDVVSWQLPNWWEAVALHHGILRCGGVSNPIIPIYRRGEVEFILRQAETKVFVHPAEFRGFDYRAMVAKMAPDLPALEHDVVVRGQSGAGLVFSELLAAGSGPELERAATDPAVLMYTSGTTSDPKGVVHPHATLVRENHGIIEAWDLTAPGHRVFMPSPVTHITGLLYGVHLPSMLGTVVVLQDVWEPKAALRLIEGPQRLHLYRRRDALSLRHDALR